MKSVAGVSVCFILFILDETQTMRYGTKIFPAQLQLSLPGEKLHLSKSLTVNVRVCASH